MPHGVSKLVGCLVGRSCTDSNCRSKEWHNAIVWNPPLKRVCLGTSTASTPIEFHRNKTTQSECWQRTPGTDSKQQDVSIIMANQTFQLSAFWTKYRQQMTMNCCSNLVVTRETRLPRPSKTETLTFTQRLVTLRYSLTRGSNGSIPTNAITYANLQFPYDRNSPTSWVNAAWYYVTELPDLQAGSEVYHGSFHGSRAAGALG